ncbi:TPA: EamA family transporter, partial [Thermoplasmata archaeon]|nr:EamA family transporter [Thermoplasmata archaeon]
MDRRNFSTAVMLTAIASLIWGTSFPGVKWGLGYVGNDVLFLWLRFAVASVFTLSIVLWLKRFSFSVLKVPTIWLIGGLNAAAFVVQYVGLNYTTASKTALLVDINVVAVAIISYFVFAERIGSKQAIGIASGVAGIVLITGDGGMSFERSEFIGDLLVFGCGWLWAFFIVMNKKIVTTYSAVEVSSSAIVTSTVWLTIPLAYVYLTGADFTVEAPAWAAVAYLGVFCTSIAILLWAAGLKGVSATSSATIMLIEIVVALAISISLLEETLRPVAAVGAALVLAAGLSANDARAQAYPNKTIRMVVPIGAGGGTDTMARLISQ